MKTCSNICRSCPFSRSGQVGLPNDEDSYDFYSRHMHNDYLPYDCPDDGGVCLGQVTMLANQCAGFMVPDPDMREAVESADIDRTVVFWQNNEFIRFHREDGIFGKEWMERQPGPRAKPKEEEPPEQGDLFS